MKLENSAIRRKCNKLKATSHFHVAIGDSYYVFIGLEKKEKLEAWKMALGFKSIEQLRLIS